MAAWFPETHFNVYLMKNNKIDINSTTTEARLKNQHRFAILRVSEIF
jgi:hypothetical protein